MPLGGPGGLQVTLDQATFDSISADLFRRARLPLDQACWTAGVDLNELQMSYAAKKEEMARKGVAKWKQDMVRGRLLVKGSNRCAAGWCVGTISPAQLAVEDDE
jgi:hypothetical protein